MKRITAVAFLFLIAAPVTGMRTPEVPPDADVRKMLADRIDVQHQSVGIVAGILEPAGRRVVSYGAPAKGDSRPLDGSTVFEIGSATKALTAILLADMAQRGEVALTDPVSKYLPADVKMPERGGKVITLEDLATHTSGLPRLPGNMAPKNPANPYADYTVDQLYQFLSGYTLTRDIGAQYEYSNLGVGLLGHVLARKAGGDYETLVRTRICEPLGMSNTRITLSPEMKTRLATGHNAALQPVGNWDLPVLAGAGALRSTADDMLKFLAAALGYTETPLAGAFAAALKVRRPTPTPSLEVALGWHVLKPLDREVIWHNGGTGGYRFFMGYDPAARVGVVMLSNTSTPAGVDDIGRHLLDTRMPLLKPAAARKEMTVDPKIFDGYVGRYELGPNFVLSIIREGDALYAQATGQGRFQLFAESERGFFAKVTDIQVVFEVDAQGRATSLVLTQAGGKVTAKRIE